jgi:hypothetical protein
MKAASRMMAAALIPCIMMLLLNRTIKHRTLVGQSPAGFPVKYLSYRLRGAVGSDAGHSLRGTFFGLKQKIHNFLRDDC